MRRRWPALLSLSIALATLMALAEPSPAAPYREYQIRFDGQAPPPLGASPSDAELINSAAWLMRQRLGLPFPAAIKAYVYVNQATLVDGLVAIAGERRDNAWDQRFAAGVASRVGIFLRGDHLARMHLLARAALFAHELTHVSQHRLAEGGRGRAAQWIREGHADWVKFQVLELLGYQAYAESRDEVVRSVVGSTTPIKFFPALPELTSNARWTQSTNQLGVAATYGQAFLAMDWLVERFGHAKIVELLWRPPLDASPEAHWGTVFPIAQRQFVDEFRARLEGLGLGSPVWARAEGPPATPRPEARAGIEGEPIPLESANSEFRDYLSSVRRMIAAKWSYPCVNDATSGQCEYRSARLVVDFGILKEGLVAHVTVRDPSGTDVYDEQAVEAIKLAAPFPPVPPALMAAMKPGSAGVNIRVTFTYARESR